MLVLYGEPNKGKSELLRTISCISARKGAKVLEVDGKKLLQPNVQTGRWTDMFSEILKEAELKAIDTTNLVKIPLERCDKAFESLIEQLGKLPHDNILLSIDGISGWLEKSMIFKDICQPFTKIDPESNLRMIIAVNEKPHQDTWKFSVGNLNLLPVGDFPLTNREWDRAVNQMSQHWQRKVDSQNDAEKTTSFLETLHALKHFHNEALSLRFIRTSAERFGAKTQEDHE